MKLSMETRATIGEAIFDATYILVASMFAFLLLFARNLTTIRLLAAIMAMILVGGDAFHLIPRIRSLMSSYHPEAGAQALGRGRQITSITMTVFYLFLWHIGHMAIHEPVSAPWTITLYCLASTRIGLCLSGDNSWQRKKADGSWRIIRNIPFLLQGMIVAAWFFVHRTQSVALGNMYLAITASFACYIPVVIFSGKKPWIGILMIPKTIQYLWMLAMCQSL
ncbi:MAG: hypothetical protein ACOX6K_01840 [Sphaerochaetaceae bacterium]|jgi:ABC-type amino acid transport system permease subunit